MINIKQIETFYWTLKLGTLQRAATRLFITQSAATKRLQELEKQACLPLFEPGSHKVQLSPKGAELLEASEGLIASLARLDALRGAAHQVQRAVRMGLTELVTITWFTDFVARTKAELPDISLHPDVDLSARLQRKLLDGDLDLVVIPQDYVTAAMASIPLQSITFTWLAPPRLFPEGTTLSLKQLALWPIIVQGPDSGITQRCEQLFAQEGIEFNHVYGSNSLFALLALIRAGVGISCLPRGLFVDEIERGEFQEVTLEVPPAAVNYHLAFLKHGRTALIDTLADLARQSTQGDARR
ncbi:LysR family transcriptional regulator [Pseudomonas sp. P7548]|uniref:LysR family transcriptional regulator n=1 Tax=Pseudomonas sp. P7548 TaxID=2726981 RepID=UPI000EE8729C|nr:LysR family transcriptional regulator [Pseudomonas sp. P7548]NWE20424.1 LysR family transcriptional regulator [Pseudomonas sp. P7548]HCT08167.1 LysR family transcriptional regulator [Pseudomonas sp.]